jgi:hypothetical protein
MGTNRHRNALAKRRSGDGEAPGQPLSDERHHAGGNGPLHLGQRLDPGRPGQRARLAEPDGRHRLEGGNVVVRRDQA